MTRDSTLAGHPPISTSSAKHSANAPNGNETPKIMATSDRCLFVLALLSFDRSQVVSTARTSHSTGSSCTPTLRKFAAFSSVTCAEASRKRVDKAAA